MYSMCVSQDQRKYYELKKMSSTSQFTHKYQASYLLAKLY